MRRDIHSILPQDEYLTLNDQLGNQLLSFQLKLSRFKYPFNFRCFQLQANVPDKVDFVELIRNRNKQTFRVLVVFWFSKQYVLQRWKLNK